MADADFLEVPVLASFDKNEPIGWLRIRRDALPATPNFCFALGFNALGYAGEPGSIPTAVYVDKYELVSVAIVNDESYSGYLKQIGVGPAQPAGDANG